MVRFCSPSSVRITGFCFTPLTYLYTNPKRLGEINKTALQVMKRDAWFYGFTSENNIHIVKAETCDFHPTPRRQRLLKNLFHGRNEDFG